MNSFTPLPLKHLTPNPSPKREGNYITFIPNICVNIKIL